MRRACSDMNNAASRRRKGRVMRAGLVSLAVVLALAGAASSASGHPRDGLAALRIQPTHSLVPQRSGAGSQTYPDRVGDAVNGAPDLSGITVANDDQGNITFTIALANHSSDFQSNEGVLVVMDTDGNAGTGDKGGFDYVYAGIKDHSGLFVWNGTTYVPATATTLQSTGVVSGQTTFKINRSDLGNTTGLTFYVETTRDNGDTIGDDAPDGTGVFTYKLVLPAPPPPPPTTTTPPAAPRFVVTPVGVPHAGKQFVVRTRVLLGAQSASPSALGCAAAIGKVAVRTAAVKGPAPYRSCVVTVPRRTTGKSLTVTLLVQYKTSGTTRRLTYKIR